MGEFAEIFIISIITDLDNIVIYTSILMRNPTVLLAGLLALFLALNRTLYVSLVQEITQIPGINIFIGIIILFIALKMTTKQIDLFENRFPSIIKVVGTILILDFFLALDGILLISTVTETKYNVFIGIFISLLILLLFSPMVFFILKFFPYFYIIAASFIGYTAIDKIVSDELIQKSLMSFNNYIFFGNIFDIICISITALIFFIGIFFYEKNKRVYPVNK
ncbi:hypothetical protein QA612_07100 [Evansella sp. AB-P1]|uniref:TerC family protein n=1 Tax=Evansella sp. AB-P1 TaxID=3037653 RepID=UPI0024202A83|nr:hypothetical protein [Evansella sp. AB-P1]MDG5787256.1 hypothetical protein [Evansella sp. AB-P1]